MNTLNTLSMLSDDQLWDVISACRTEILRAFNPERAHIGEKAERKLKEAMNEWDARVCERAWAKRCYGERVS